MDRNLLQPSSQLKYFFEPTIKLLEHILFQTSSFSNIYESFLTYLTPSQRKVDAIKRTYLHR